MSSYQPILTTPAETTYPFVWKVVLSTAGNEDTKAVGAELVKFTVTFNRDMDQSVQPSVSFGPDTPVTDYTVHPINGGWKNARVWEGTFRMTPITGDGYQLMRIAGPARAADDPWLVIGDDSGRFRFEIITSGSEAMNLQATGGEGFVDLMWTQDDFPLLAGYNLYRSTSANGTYTRLNTTVMPATQKTFKDTNVTPGQTYYYKFTVVKTDMSESAFSNVAAATPIDTIPPVITHTPVGNAAVGLALQLYADVTDNVRMDSVTLKHRAIGQSDFQGRAMVKTTGNRYSATLEGSLVTAPGLEYYLEASDGISIVRHGRSDAPYRVAVTDSPQVTAISPNKGPASGGTAVSISGTNFKAGASVTLGGAVASDVVIAGSSQITAVAPAHLPAVVDVVVTNPGGAAGTLLRGFTYESDTAAVSLPDAIGDANAVVEIPISLDGVKGMLAADVTVRFDQAVLTARGARKGALVPSFSLETNTSVAGEVKVSLASATAVTGSGVLAYLEFLVAGAPGASTDLTLASASLNDGAIPVTLDHGAFTVKELLDISGQVVYYQAGRQVSGVSLVLAGDQSFNAASDEAGQYSITGATTGNYVLTPSKSEDTSAVTAYDASFILRAAAGLINLSAYQQTAADVDRSGGVSAMDASYVLQKSAELLTLPFPGAGKIWTFDPANRSFQPLSADLTGQDFTAILIGDVSGNWGASSGQGQAAAAQAKAATAATATLTLPSLTAGTGSRLTVPLQLAMSQGELYAADLLLTYDPAVIRAVSAAGGDLASDFSIAVNPSQPGQVRIALAGSRPITSGVNFCALPSTSSEARVLCRRWRWPALN